MDWSAAHSAIAVEVGTRTAGFEHGGSSEKAVDKSTVKDFAVDQCTANKGGYVKAVVPIRLPFWMKMPIYFDPVLHRCLAVDKKTGESWGSH